MGATVEDPGFSASKPRQFQVVPVPGVFSRGRWKCCDFRDTQHAEPDILEFPKHGENSNHDHDTIVVTSIAPSGVKTLDSGIETTRSAPSGVEMKRDEHLVSNAPATFTAQMTEDARMDIQEQNLARQASSATVNIPPVTSYKPLSFDESQHQMPQIGIHAIDSKIEQAMDLVKSHLTFAVREEVEELRKTITKLEAKISLLETENAVLKKFAAPDVVANLNSMVQSQQLPSIHVKHAQTEPDLPSSNALSPNSAEGDRGHMKVASSAAVLDNSQNPLAS